MNLGEYIKAATGRKFEWGNHDCSTFCAHWVFSNTDYDPMGDIWGRYDDEQSARDFILQNGGLLELWAKNMGVYTSSPIEGAIGVLDIAGEHMMGIFTGERWIILMESGIKAIRLPSAKIVRAWNIG